MNSKRETWLDFIKIMASFLVVILHTVCYGVRDKVSSPALLIYYIGTFAIPLFWMVNGYLQLRREVTYKYVCKKILKVLFVVSIWNLLIILLKFLVKGEFENPIVVILNSFIQKGYFSQFWFLGALILIYLFLPLLSRLFNNTKNAYKVLVLILLIVCVLVDIYNIYNYSTGGKIIKQTVIQTFRLWTWLLYFCIGGYLSKNNILEKISTKKHYICLIILGIITIGYEYLCALKLYGSLSAENFYDSILVILTSIIIFTCLKKTKYKKKEIVSQLGTLSMGVYIVHMSIIKFIQIFIPLNNNFINIFISIVVFLVSILVSYIISRIPKINALIKL